MNLIPDGTVFIQMGTFLGSYFALKHLVFKPYLRLVELREEKTEGLRAQAADLEARALKYQEDYEAFMVEERKKASTWLDGQRTDLANKERESLQKARDQVAAELEKWRTQVMAESAKTREALLPLVSEFAGDITKKLTGNKAKGTLSPPRADIEGATAR